MLKDFLWRKKNHGSSPGGDSAASSGDVGLPGIDDVLAQIDRALSNGEEAKQRINTEGMTAEERRRCRC